MNAGQLRVCYRGGTEGGVVRVHVDLGNGATHEFSYRSPDVPLSASTEALVAATLLPAMKTGRALVCDGAVSRRFSGALDGISETFTAWEPSLRRVPITGLVPEARGASTADRIGAFFSGGVDSFYTLLTHRAEITDLIFIHGFDIRLDQHSLRERASRAIREIGASFDKRVIEVETDLRGFLRLYVPWARLAHGAAMASVGLLLAPLFRRLYIASTHTDPDVSPWGTHPALDPLWSTEELQFVHDGNEMSRVAKVRSISRSEVVLRFLRVCSANGAGAYNCGRCEKCLRTMVSLHAVGALDRCATFDRPLEAKQVRRILALDDSTRGFVEENLGALGDRPGDRELRRALGKVLSRPRWRARLIRSLQRQGERQRRRVLGALRRLGGGLKHGPG